MKNILLGVIATCLILITGKMYLGNMQTAQAQTTNDDIKAIVSAICFQASLMPLDPELSGISRGEIRKVLRSGCYREAVEKN